MPAIIVTGDTAAQRLRMISSLASTVLDKPIDGTRLARALTEAVEVIEAGAFGVLASHKGARDDG